MMANRAGAHALRAVGQPPTEGEQSRFWARPSWWVQVVPPLVTLAVMLWGVDGPSYTTDESASLSAVHRSFPDLLRMLQNIDAVHGAYYALLWVVVRLGGTGELATRLPSAVAMAATAAAVTALGRRLLSPRAGLAAGLVFACLPMVSYFGQLARPYAIMTAFGTLSSYLLVRVLDAEPEKRPGWLVAYSACLIGLGLAQIFGLLLLAAHAVTVAVRCRPGSGEPAGRRLAVGWLAAVAAAIAVTSPVILLGWRQRGVTAPIIGSVPWPERLEELFGSWAVTIAIGAVLACGIAVGALAGRLPASWPRRLIALCVPWLVLPPVLLLAASSLSSPLYTVRYVMFCLPALALLVAAALVALGRAAGIAALIAIVIVGIPAQLSERGPAGHGRDIRKLDQIIAAHRRPGDAALYGGLVTQYQRFAYPYGMTSLRDIALARTPAESATLTGTTVHGRALRDRLAGVSRVWLVEGGRQQIRMFSRILDRAGFRLARVWLMPPYITLKLFERPPGSG